MEKGRPKYTAKRLEIEGLKLCSTITGKTTPTKIFRKRIFAKIKPH